jgi:hypothetical protein
LGGSSRANRVFKYERAIEHEILASPTEHIRYTVGYSIDGLCASGYFYAHGNGDTTDRYSRTYQYTFTNEYTCAN